MPKQINKVTFHYSNGKSYTIKNVYIDCWVDWSNMTVGLVPEPELFISHYVQNIPKDCICVETEGNNSVVSFWMNPSYEISLKTNIKTSKQRMRENNKSEKPTPCKGSFENKKKTYIDSIYPIWKSEKNQCFNFTRHYWEPNASRTYLINDFLSPKNSYLYLNGHHLYGESIIGTVEELKNIAQSWEINLCRK